MPILAVLALLAQTGPLVTGGAAPPIQPVPIRERGAAKPTAAPVPPATAPSRLQQCLTLADSAPLDAIELGEDWLRSAKGSALADPNHCLGAAHNRLGRAVQAEVAFVAARDAVPFAERGRRAALGAMAALTMLDQDDPARADATFAAAHADAQAAGNAALAADIAIDRARAQVALKQDQAAALGLAEGRVNSPANPLGWLLSATLARRQGDLAAAQGFIEQAAVRAPRDPAVGLEAGVIAVLAGREAAARKSWQSVLRLAPDSDEAKTAQGYLDQLGPEPASSGR